MSSLPMPVYEGIKRAIDVALSAQALCALHPLLLGIAVAIKLDSKGPVFYRGARVGRHGRMFHIYKFRTMVADAENRGGTSTADDDPRITRVGQLLRRTKFDELPQLINVLKGEMSLVGPRPQVKWAVDLYSAEERTLLSLRPGLTDHSSIKFSQEGQILKGSSDPDRDYMEKIHPVKMRLSLDYSQTRSLRTDFGILVQTAVAIVKPLLWRIVN